MYLLCQENPDLRGRSDLKNKTQPEKTLLLSLEVGKDASFILKV